MSEPINGTRWRLDDHSRRLEIVERQTVRVPVLEERVGNLSDDVRGLGSEMRGVKRALWGFAAAVMVSALTFALTVGVGGLG